MNIDYNPEIVGIIDLILYESDLTVHEIIVIFICSWTGDH